MRVLVIGGGGREHALCWKIARSTRCEELWCAPGNPGIASVAICVDLELQDHTALASFCVDNSIDLVVVGPEQPLVDGLADHLRVAGVAVFGPSAAAAQLEGSKSFAKDFMARHGIPTASARVFTDSEALLAYLSECPVPIVVKADGLAAGKGVMVCMSRQQALDAGRAIAVELRFGAAGERVVVEEFMSGEEATVLALVDGDVVVPLRASQDHKRRFEGDRGPNTGGMGAYTPVPSMDDELMDRVRREILEPAARGLKAEGMLYRGVLYAGLMLGPEGPRVVEFNCRFGDPETQPLMLSLRSDLLSLLWATATGRLEEGLAVNWHAGASLCVVLVSGGYPGTYPKGLPISGLPVRLDDDKLVIFHAGTRSGIEGEILTHGGRVLGVTVRAPDLSAARSQAYAAAKTISWRGMDYRKDIATRALGPQSETRT